VTPAAEAWERAYRAARDARRQTPGAQSDRRRYEDRRAAGLCGACGKPAATASCEACKAKGRQACRERVGRKTRPYRRREGRP